MLHLGFYNTATTRTRVRFMFSTHAAAGGNVAPNSAFENTDIRIYRANDSAATSATQRSSSNGITMTSPFDSLTGVHDVDIDLTDNTDAGFYAAGYQYQVVLAPDETVDSQTITGVLLAVFEIGVPAVNVSQFGGTAGTFASGRPEVNVNSLAANSITAAATAADFSTEVNAGVLAVLGALNDAAADGAVTTTDTIVAYLKQIINTLEGTPGIPTFPAAAVPGNAVSIAEVLRQIYDEVAGVNGATPLDAAGIRSAVGLAAADLDTQLDGLDTKLDTIDNFLDTEIAAIISTLGTPAGASVSADIAAIEGQTDDIGVAGAGLTAVPWNASWDAEVQSEVNDALNEAISELTGVPSSTPTIRQALMFLFMGLRNRRETTATEDTVQNDAGGTIATATLSDDATTFTKGKYA